MLKPTCRTPLRNCGRWSARSSASGGGCTGPSTPWPRAGRAAGDIVSFREMQEQARKVDRRRVEIAVRIAELQGN
jgi:hypothetical protein